jgi:hypothetical protein
VSRLSCSSLAAALFERLHFRLYSFIASPAENMLVAATWFGELLPPNACQMPTQKKDTWHQCMLYSWAVSPCFNKAPQNVRQQSHISCRKTNSSRSSSSSSSSIASGSGSCTICSSLQQQQQQQKLGRGAIDGFNDQEIKFTTLW